MVEDMLGSMCQRTNEQKVVERRTFQSSRTRSRLRKAEKKIGQCGRIVEKEHVSSTWDEHVSVSERTEDKKAGSTFLTRVVRFAALRANQTMSSMPRSESRSPEAVNEMREDGLHVTRTMKDSCSNRAFQ
jgi:hypothetical protein